MLEQTNIQTKKQRLKNIQKGQKRGILYKRNKETKAKKHSQKTPNLENKNRKRKDNKSRTLACFKTKNN